MGVGDIWLEIFDALETEIKKIENIEEVIQGWKDKIDKWPTIYIIPIPSSVTPASPKKSDYYFRFEVVVVVRNVDLKQGIRDAVNICGQVIDKLIVDRSLGEKCENLETWEIIPNWDNKSTYESQWASVTVECQREI